MTEIFAGVLSKWTPGATGIWVLVIMALLGWWQGLPKFLDAMANRQSKVEERMGLLLAQATERFEREIAAADKRHDDCMEGQKRQVERIDQLERERRIDRECIDAQQETIAGLKRQIVQMQMSAIRADGGGVTPLARAVVGRLDAMPEKKS